MLSTTTSNVLWAHMKICQISKKWLIVESVHSVSDIVEVIKSRRMGWAGHVARMGERRGMYRFWWGNLKEREHLGNRDVDW